MVPFFKLRSSRTSPRETNATALVEKQVHRKTRGAAERSSCSDYGAKWSGRDGRQKMGTTGEKCVSVSFLARFLPFSNKTDSPLRQRGSHQIMQKPLMSKNSSCERQQRL
jgi:hypothetical protein